MADNSDPFPKLGTVYRKSSGNVNKLSRNVANISLNRGEDPNCKVNPWDSQSGIASNPRIPHNSASNAWGHPNLIQKAGVQKSGWSGPDNDNTRPTQTTVGNSWPKQTNEAWGNDCKASQLSASPTLDNADEIISNAQSRDFICYVNAVNDDTDEAEDFLYDSDDDFFDNDSDSDISQMTHENRKKSKWFKAFFQDLDKLTVDEINSSARKWHCPACQGGPGAISWYRGLQPLLVHAKTKKTRRAAVHREFAKILDEEICRRRISVIPVSGVSDRWEGLSETVKDQEIVWPPIVIIMNTRNEQDENGKWNGMGNQDLLDYFHNYAAMKARHSYGPQGHRGMSVLVFESSAAGYMEAARLHKHFKEQGRDKEAWNCSPVLFRPGGKRQLYGFMAMEEDLDIFNQHAQGRSKLKFEMRSYQQMVGSQINQMKDASQQLIQLKDKFVKEQKNSQVLAESLGRVSEKLRQTTEENRLVRQRTKLQHEQTKEEMDAQEQFFKDQMKIIREAIETKEYIFEKIQQAEREKVEQSDAHNSNVGHREEEIAVLLTLKDREWEEFEAERDKLIKNHQEIKAASKRRYWDEQIELEKELEKELTLLMEKYTPTGI